MSSGPLTFSDVKSYLTAGLTALGKYPTLPVISPGVNTDDVKQKITPQRLIFASVSDGSGFNTELLFDNVFLNVRTIGMQRSYDDGETLSNDVDKILTVSGNTMFGTTGVLFVVRTGGRPTLLQRDSADRYHFQCTYVANAQTGL